jgi:Ca2+-binding RTX toxin-like protein
MKRFTLFFLAVVVTMTAVAIGAGSALAATLKFNPQTGDLVYEAVPGESVGIGDVNKVILNPPYTNIAGYTVSLTDENWSKNWFPQGATLFLDAGAQKSCFSDNGGYAITCPAKKVTIKTGLGNDQITVSYNLKIPTALEGGPGSDIIYGGSGADAIWGGCSADVTCDTVSNSLHGGEGNDVLHGGGVSYDYLAGDPGDDVLDGGFGGHDNLFGGDGRDTADYSSRTNGIVASLEGVANDGEAGENDFIAADVEAVQGGSGKDTLYAGFLINSILKGGSGDDTLVGYAGNDLLMGEAGTDSLRPGSGKDNAYGGSGQDTVSYAERLNPVTVTLDGAGNDGETGENDFVASDVENIAGGKSNDTLTGDGQANKLFGAAGDDTLDGNGGQPDGLYGEAGNDTLGGGPAGSFYDVLDGGADTDLVSYASRTDGVTIMLGVTSGQEDKILNVENAKGGSGNDKMVGTDGTNAFFGNGGNDGLQGNGAKDYLYGGEGNDTLWGNAGNDNLVGSTGNDTMDGGPGADWFSGWDGIDQVTYAGYTAAVTVTIDGQANDGASGEGDNVVPGVEIVIGGQSGDTLTGDDLANWFYGGPGKDKLFGLGGNDMLDGQGGTDNADGGVNVDTCFAETKGNCEK